MNEKWEYKVCVLSHGAYESPYVQVTTEELNKFGNEGWELVGLDGHSAVFKRKKI